MSEKVPLLFHEEITRTMLSKFEAISSELSYLEERLNWLAREVRLILCVVSELKDREKEKEVKDGS